jgi:hypothetical protein
VGPRIPLSRVFQLADDLTPLPGVVGWRYWIPAFANASMDKFQFTKEDAYDWTTQFIGRFSDHGTPHMDDIFLPADHPAVQAHLDKVGDGRCRRLTWDPRLGVHAPDLRVKNLHLSEVCRKETS